VKNMQGVGIRDLAILEMYVCDCDGRVSCSYSGTVVRGAVI